MLFSRNIVEAYSFPSELGMQLIARRRRIALCLYIVKPSEKGTSRGNQEELSLMPSYETDVLAQLCTN